MFSVFSGVLMSVSYHLSRSTSNPEIMLYVIFFSTFAQLFRFQAISSLIFCRNHHNVNDVCVIFLALV